MNGASNTKYRPYFTSSELAETIRCVKLGSTNLALIRYLEGYALKIGAGILTPSITLAPAFTDTLELEDSRPDKQNLLSKRQAAYSKWCTDPSTCTPGDIELTHLYRYENDLMSPEEETIYLQSQGA